MLQKARLLRQIILESCPDSHERNVSTTFSIKIDARRLLIRPNRRRSLTCCMQGQRIEESAAGRARTFQQLVRMRGMIWPSRQLATFHQLPRTRRQLQGWKDDRQPRKSPPLRETLNGSDSLDMCMWWQGKSKRTSEELVCYFWDLRGSSALG